MKGHAKKSAPEAIINGFRDQGFKLTSARRAIVEILHASTAPLSVTQLLAALAERKEKADKTTVYREIQFMTERGVVTEVHFGDRTKRYEMLDGGHHHHLVCVECGTAVDVPLENDLASAEKAIERKTGYKIMRHALEFFGVCGSCR
jgi:Fe2+ or Zn2+ uptake regulation protein